VYRASRFAALALTLGTLIVPIAAHADTAGLVFSPPSYEFEPRILGTGASPPQSFVLTNIGESSQTIDYTALAWGPQEYAEPELFKITSDDCSTLAPGGDCTLEIIFNPVLPGPKWGNLTVGAPWSENCNLKRECQPINVHTQLHLTGTASTVSLSPTLLTFRPLEVGTGPSPSKNVTLSNEGETDLTIFRVMLANYQHHESSQFRISGGTCGAELVLPPHGSCTVAVAFAPSKPGALSAEIGVFDSASVGRQFATLEGEGVSPALGSQGPPLPRLSIFRHPDTLTAKRQAALWFTGPQNAVAFECKLDANAFAPCTSPARFKHLKLGRHFFAVRALEGNRNGGSDVAEYRWRIDPGSWRRRASFAPRALAGVEASNGGFLLNW
jgi:hypothetical protein